MAKVKDSTLQNYKAQISWTTDKKLPFSQGYTINALIKEYQIPAIRWGYDGSLIGLETKRQYLFWRDLGTSLEFKGLINKNGGEEKPKQKTEKTLDKKVITREKYYYFLNVLPPLTMGKQETILFLEKYDKSLQKAAYIKKPAVLGAFMQGEGLDKHTIYVREKGGKYYELGQTREAWNTEMFRYYNWKELSQKEIDRLN